MKTLILNNRIHKADVESFCKECKKYYPTSNNISLDSIKYDQLNDDYGIWIGTFNNNKLISLSGVHKLFDGVRVFFRGATLPSYAPRKHLGKNIMKQMFHIQHHLPLQLQWGKEKKFNKFYITTNINVDKHLHRMNKIILPLLERQGLVNFVEQKEVFYTQQNIWRINVDNYWRAYESIKF